MSIAKKPALKTTKTADEFIAAAQNSGMMRFRNNMALVAAELEKIIPPGANVLFSHVMAGGFPRSRVFMLLLNRVFKSTGEKYLESAKFWNSGVGRLCEAAFNEVSADTFRYLLDETTALRERNTSAGSAVRYSAYGYHGTGVLVDGEYCWQSYIPYLPGWSKMRLEDVAAEAQTKGIVASVYNCPEIQTNSSALFLGVEISLYPLISAIRKEVGDQAADLLAARCQEMLKDGETVAAMLERANRYLAEPVIRKMLDFKTWPQHNTLEQAELMLAASLELMAMHADQKQLVGAELSRIVFMATGRLMLHSSWNPVASTLWLGHDIIARLLADSRGTGIL